MISASDIRDRKFEKAAFGYKQEDIDDFLAELTDEFEQIDEDCLDAVCELINVSNGLFASKVSQEDVQIDMLPPNMFVESTTVSSEGLMFMLPCFIKGQRADIVICKESKWHIG